MRGIRGKDKDDDETAALMKNMALDH